MPAPKSSSSGGSRRSSRSAGSGMSSGSKPQARRAKSGPKRTTAATKTAPSTSNTTGAGVGVGDGLASFAEQLANRIIKPLDLVMITRDRIQETLDEAAERGRVTRSDANELVAELVKRGRQQTDDLLKDIEGVVGRGREQLETATRRARRTDPVDRLVRSADRARRTVGVGPLFPIVGYDDLTAAQVEERLDGLTPAELRKVRDYERRHLNRKSVLAAVEKALR
jgi:polyhydroxyalkanoate synthesis regulator phasin